MIIHPVQTKTEDGRCSVSAAIELETPALTFASSGSPIETLWIDWPDSYYTPTSADASPFAVMCLTLAMSINERLRISDRISQTLLTNLLEAMEIYNTDFRGITRVIDIEARCYHPRERGQQRIASFFSGGVDSLYNLAEQQRLKELYQVDPVTDVWLIQGMDIKLTEHTLWTKVKKALQGPFEGFEELRYVDIRTNARTIHDRFVSWERLGFSAILGGIAKCFAPLVETVLIGSYAKYRDLIPHSSSPLVDPMWSCDQQTVRHFSCRADRLEKIATISRHAPQLLPALRVCYKNPDDAYNCGTCEKCLRTQLQLMLCGSLDRCDTFSVPLSTASLKKNLWLPWHSKNDYTWTFWEDIEAGCKAAGFNDYYTAIRRQLSINRADRIRKKLRFRFRSAARGLRGSK